LNLYSTEGFWRAYPPIAKLGLRFEQVSTPSWFLKDPLFAWAFFGHRYKLYNTTKPHEGYHILKRIGDQILQTRNGSYFVFTSNVDGHFLKSGTADERIIECHGSLQYLQYLNDDRIMGKVFPVTNELDRIEINPDTFKVKDNSMLPRKQGHLLRPNVLMFDDYTFETERLDVQQDNWKDFRHDLLYSGSDGEFVVIEIGAGTFIPTVRRT
jgi:NAD-dependent SIR2 family protein deacetylase